MLFMLYQMGSAGGPSWVLGGKDASQDSRVVGGMGAIYQPIAAELGDAIQLSQPVRYITQDADGVTVRSETDSIRARRAIVAVPLAIASQIIYEPMLPTDRSFLHQRMPSGAIIKISIVYDEPFWRADGLCGQSAAPGSFATGPSTPVPTPVRRASCASSSRAPSRGNTSASTRANAGRRYSTPWSTIRREGRRAGRIPRTELDPRTVFRRRDAQPRAARGAHRVRPCAA